MTERILVRAPNWIGDAVMSLPFFASLRQNAPRAEITCLCRKFLTPIYAAVEAIDRVIPLDETKGRSGWRMNRHNARILREKRFAYAFCLPPSLGSALMLWLARIPRRFGFSADWRRPLLSSASPYPQAGERPHRVESYLGLLDLAWREAGKDRVLHYTPPADAVSVAAALWRENGLSPQGPVLALAPGSAQPARRWRGDRFALLARRWIDTTNGMTVVTGSESERPVCEDVRVRAGARIVNLAGAGDIAVAAALLQRADLFVGNDSGLAHLAAAVGTPTVVISGPGDPAEIAPYTQHAISVEKSLFCAPCHKGTCRRKDHPRECLDIISVDDVWVQMQRFMP